MISQERSTIEARDTRWYVCTACGEWCQFPFWWRFPKIVHNEKNHEYYTWTSTVVMPVCDDCAHLPPRTYQAIRRKIGGFY